ncbi:MAG: hypothetical protein DRJ18_01655 [Candidatus Methanomethylicota archaeon]|nr:MAG: hypothetical protein DRJ18_01655 [Candidatus Verstraetearchaeota archaeon]
MELSILSNLQMASMILTLIISLISSAVIGFHVTYYWIGKIKSREAEQLKKLETAPPITIIVPVRNEPIGIITRLLEALAQQQYPKDKMEIIVVSDDEEAYFKEIKQKLEEISSEKSLSVRIFRRENPKGFKAGALNYALQRSNGKYVVIFDADAVPEPNYLKKAIQFLEANSEIDGLAARWIPLNMSSTPISEAQAVSLDFLTSIFYEGRSRIEGPIIAPGCGCIFRKKAVLKVGGWNEDCLAEDVELSVKLLLSGGKIAYLSSANVKVENPETYGAFKKQQARWIYGSTQVLVKYFTKIIKSNIPLLWKLDLILYLLQYHVLLANFAFASLALASILAQTDLLLPSIYFSPILMALLAIQAYAYYDTARKLGFNTIKSITVMGRCTAIAAALAPLVLLQNAKILTGFRERWYTTPKGPLAKAVKGLNLAEPLLGIAGTLAGLLLLKMGFTASAMCLFTLSLPFIYVSWKAGRGVW